MLLLFVLSAFGRAASLECYKCIDRFNQEDCMATVTCHDGQVCYTNRTYSGQIVVYDMGCCNKQTCRYIKHQNASGDMEPKNDLTHDCHTCCSTDKCNRNLCKYKHPPLCVDTTADCAYFDYLFNICASTSQARKVCPKYCDLCNVVDGNWSPWSTWSNCDVSCENGTLTRKRSCSNPTPQNGGLDCHGNVAEVKSCFKGLCPIHGGWNQWKQWGSCSATCGFGMQRRRRTCTNPFPKRFGDHCFGDSLEYRQCLPGPCANGGWSNWQTWGDCNGEECGSGFRQRTRTCSNPKPSPLGSYCPGSPVEIGSCKTTCHGGWSDWQKWSNCIGVYCVTGVRVRTRTCSNPRPSKFGDYCSGNSNETITCETECSSDCYEIRRTLPNPRSGIYTVQLWQSKKKIRVYCDMDTNLGGWTVFQYRFNGSVDFYRNLEEYEEGFGDLNNEFWMGLRYMQEIASQGENDLRIDLEAAEGTRAFEMFTNFSLSQSPYYTLHLGATIASLNISSKYSFGHLHNGKKFSTYDHDVDKYIYSCAVEYHGAWWYGNCCYANLNGKYMKPGTQDFKAMNYRSFLNYPSLKSSKMMMRRKSWLNR